MNFSLTDIKLALLITISVPCPLAHAQIAIGYHGVAVQTVKRFIPSIDDKNAESLAIDLEDDDTFQEALAEKRLSSASSDIDPYLTLVLKDAFRDLLKSSNPKSNLKSSIDLFILLHHAQLHALLLGVKVSEWKTISHSHDLGVIRELIRNPNPPFPIQLKHGEWAIYHQMVPAIEALDMEQKKIFFTKLLNVPIKSQFDLSLALYNRFRNQAFNVPEENYTFIECLFQSLQKKSINQRFYLSEAAEIMGRVKKSSPVLTAIEVWISKLDPKSRFYFSVIQARGKKALPDLDKWMRPDMYGRNNIWTRTRIAENVFESLYMDLHPKTRDPVGRAFLDFLSSEEYRANPRESALGFWPYIQLFRQNRAMAESISHGFFLGQYIPAIFCRPDNSNAFTGNHQLPSGSVGELLNIVNQLNDPEITEELREGYENSIEQMHNPGVFAFHEDKIKKLVYADTPGEQLLRDCNRFLNNK